MLKEHKEAIKLSLPDIKGIRPSMSVHIIHLKDDSKHSMDSQGHLNPTMKEVVQTEVLKRLDAGVI